MRAIHTVHARALWLSHAVEILVTASSTYVIWCKLAFCPKWALSSRNVDSTTTVACWETVSPDGLCRPPASIEINWLNLLRLATGILYPRKRREQFRCPRHSWPLEREPDRTLYVHEFWAARVLQHSPVRNEMPVGKRGSFPTSVRRSCKSSCKPKLTNGQLSKRVYQYKETNGARPLNSTRSYTHERKGFQRLLGSLTLRQLLSRRWLCQLVRKLLHDLLEMLDTFFVFGACVLHEVGHDGLVGAPSGRPAALLRCARRPRTQGGCNRWWGFRMRRHGSQLGVNSS